MLQKLIQPIFFRALAFILFIFITFTARNAFANLHLTPKHSDPDISLELSLGSGLSGAGIVGDNIDLERGAPSCVNTLGGDKGHVDGSSVDAIGVAAHEIPHFVGIDDQYDEGVDNNGNRTTTPRPTMGNNIMATNIGTEITSSQVSEARNNSSTTKCTISSSGNSC